MSHATTLTFSVVLLMCLTVCSSHQQGSPANSQQTLMGKWEESETPNARHLVQFEFLADGTAIKNNKELGKFTDRKWHQLATGTFRLIDPTHIKVELQPSFYFGASIYELQWRDQDDVAFRAGDETIALFRVKP